MAFTPAPPTPDRADKLTFPSRMYNWFTWFVATIAELSTLGSAYNLATTTTSVTSNTIGTGSKSFTVGTGLGFVPGMPLNIAYTTTPTNSFFGYVTSYNSGTGALVVNVTSVLGSGTQSAWTISLAASAGGATLGANIFTALQRWTVGANIASAATVDLTAATGNTINITGTSATSAFTLTAGQWMLLVPTGAWPLTYHATNCNINGGASYTCQVGDRIYVGKDAAGVTYVNVIKQNGRAIVDFDSIASFTAVTNTPANGVTITIPAGSLQFRSTTLPTGTPVTRTIASPISLVISSGSTLGATNGVASRIVVLAIDNAGTVEVAAVNINSGLALDESALISTTAEGGAGAADSELVIYSTTARTNVAYRVIGYYDETQTTAGTHTSALTLVQGVGGNNRLSPQREVLSTATAVTSIDFTGLPVAKKYTIKGVGLSTSGTSVWGIQLGDSGGPENTGYAGAVSNSSTAINSTTLASMQTSVLAAASYNFHATIEPVDVAGNSWIIYGGCSRTDAADSWSFSFSKTLTGVLDRLRFTTTNGTDTVDVNGGVNISCEQ